jgi:hypothetical protein
MYLKGHHLTSSQTKLRSVRDIALMHRDTDISDLRPLLRASLRKCVSTLNLILVNTGVHPSTSQCQPESAMLDPICEGCLEEDESATHILCD